MALSQLTRSTPKAQAAPAAAATPAPAETAPAIPATPTPDTTALSLMPETGAVTVADALNAALTAGDSGRAGSAFPVVTQTSGAQGGQFAPADFLPTEVQDTLPSGKKPITAVFLGYRLAVSAWAMGYNDAAAQPKDPNAGAPKPVYAASVGANDVNGTRLVMAAAKNYQFTKSADKAKFDYATSKAGHVKAQVEMLVYLPETNGVVVVSAAAGYGNTEATLKSLVKLVDPKTGALGQFPCQLRPVSEDKTSKSGHSWKQHSIDITTLVTSEGVAALSAYQTWRANAVQDTATVTAVREWLSGADRKLTGDIEAALKAAASL